MEGRKIQRIRPDAPLELYNLKEDKGEESNVAKDYPDVIEEMEKIIDTARTPSEVFTFDQGTYLNVE